MDAPEREEQVRQDDGEQSERPQQRDDPLGVQQDAKQDAKQDAQADAHWRSSQRSLRSRESRERATDMRWRDLDGVRVGTSEASHVLIINGRVLRLSRTQYRLLAFLLDAFPHPVTVEDLTRHVFDCDYSPAERRRVQQQIYRVRNKLGGAGLRIWPVIHFGYLLLRDQDAL